MYTAIIPATDWFFAHKRVNEQEPTVVWNLAAWGLKEDGDVIGARRRIRSSACGGRKDSASRFGSAGTGCLFASESADRR